MSIFMGVAQWVGVAVVSYFVFLIVVEVLRSLWWSVWTMYPLMKGNPDKATVWSCIKYVWQCFNSEMFSTYDKKCSALYTHGYWPWHDRKWFIKYDI